MKRAKLKCRVGRGPFSDERVVEVTTVDGTTRAYVVPMDEVDESSSRVLVDVEERAGVVWARLPTDHPYHAVPVRASDLSTEDLVPA